MHATMMSTVRRVRRVKTWCTSAASEPTAAKIATRTISESSRSLPFQATSFSHCSDTCRASVPNIVAMAATMNTARSPVTAASVMIGSTTASRMITPSATAPSASSGATRHATTNPSRTTGTATSSVNANPAFDASSAPRDTGRVSQNAVVPTSLSPCTSCTAVVTSSARCRTLSTT